MDIDYPHPHVDVKKYPAIPVVVWQGMAIGYYFKSPYPGYPHPIREGDLKSPNVVRFDVLANFNI